MTLSSCSGPKVDNSWGKTPEEIKKLRQKEFKKLKRKKGEIKDQFTFYIESNGPYQVKKTQKYTLIKSTINSKETIDCFIYNDQKLVSKHIWELTEKFVDGAKKFEYLKSRSGIFDSDPYLSLQTQFLDQDGNLNLLKVISVKNRQRQITCLNKDMGYIKSFRRVVADFISSINYKVDKKNRFEQVSFISRGKNRFGYQRDTLSTLVGGGDLLKNTNHHIQITSPTEIQAVDEVILQSVDKNYKFKELYLEGYVNGDRVKQVMVQPDGVGTYSVNVELNGKGVEGTYPLKNMTSNLIFEKDIYKKLNNNKEFSELTFWPTHDYIRPMQTKFAFQKWVKGKKYITVKFGKSSEIWRYDDDGQVDLKVVKKRGKRLVLKRAYRNGEL
jgi:hypothetical protein